MTLRLTLLGAAALTLAATGAYAQNTQHDGAMDATPGYDMPATNPAAPVNAPADVPAAADAATPMQAPTGVPANVADTSTATTTTMANGATLTHRVITNGPVPDTAENRARYGGPMSRAGRQTSARGN